MAISVAAGLSISLWFCNAVLNTYINAVQEQSTNKSALSYWFFVGNDISYGALFYYFLKYVILSITLF